MTPDQKIRHTALIRAIDDGSIKDVLDITEENVDELFEEYEDVLYDIMYEIREGDIETDIPCAYSRHYESRSVAMQAPDGTWVGWTYWYGGGKHGEPEAVEWVNESYDLDVKEEEKLVIVRTFTKV